MLACQRERWIMSIFNKRGSLTSENGTRVNHRSSCRALTYGIDPVHEMQQESSEQPERIRGNGG
jgi:hypothetical protein